MYNMNYIGEDKIGETFQTDFIGKAMKKIKNGKIITHLNTTLDYNEGTDMSAITNVCAKNYNKQNPKLKQYEFEIRIDPTLNFNDKTYMPFIYETDIPCTQYQNFKIGIRIGHKYKDEKTNKIKYHNFEKPVVVIGANIKAAEYNSQYDIIDKNMDKYMDQLIYEATDALADFITKNPNARNDLINTPLKSNPKFRENKYCAKKYKELIHLRTELDKDENYTGYDEYENDESHLTEYYKLK